MMNKHMKICAISNVIRELQNKMVMRYHKIPIRMAKIQTTDKHKSWQGPRALLVEMQNDTLPKTVWQFLTKQNILLPYNPPIMLTGIFPNE